MPQGITFGWKGGSFRSRFAFPFGVTCTHVLIKINHSFLNLYFRTTKPSGFLSSAERVRVSIRIYGVRDPSVVSVRSIEPTWRPTDTRHS
jgi:hypothetical protein